jgi:hypothetical protein
MVAGAGGTAGGHLKAVFSPRLVRQFSSNFTMQKEDSLSHQNVGKCMEY